ncbi:hypothetical protein ESY86_09255 [Subsaximicrobium wynnwilliamsii]|uniref:Uncharacterized protein n=1 Tax=Subsaximicrobium wynnwilliamsii TaxID=291179 RepID=A0A5C6ZGY4_9FLAO|nr:hypothetical protein ESY87_09560 [Subsaximicrobium wynnwilliamsii]TXD89225.1 hypothetical protein ESY86_09255 [Subsaximicrobium wynnwilliamsii]TXE03180.1 hypothetical protein ESY88_09270 [Subsaximicrobium wynnwilliamsii]
MKLLNFFQYVYLIFAILFIVDGFYSLGSDGSRAIISFIFAGLAIFMFFFRRRFKKKFENRKDS